MRPSPLPFSDIPLNHVSVALEALRSATRQRHHALDSRLPVAQPGAGHRDYVRHLEVLYGWLKPLNGHVWSLGWPDVINAATRGNKINLIEHDLKLAANLGLCEAIEPALCARVPHLNRLDAYAVGVAYVIEGAQLGGAMLARRLAAEPVLPAFSYLVGYGQATSSMWKQFLAFMDETVTTSQQIEQAVRGACDAFDTLIAWMTVEGLLEETEPRAAHVH
jgi:heme oxygenase